MSRKVKETCIFCRVKVIAQIFMDASIIMLQKVAAMVDKVAAYLHFIACEMR